MSSSTSTSFNPTTLFFYGTLMIPEQLNRVLGRSTDSTHNNNNNNNNNNNLPTLRKASIRNNNNNYKMKMWGPYPVLVKLAQQTVGIDSNKKEENGEEEEEEKEEEVITGMAYTLESRDDLWKLAYYEGYNYELMEVDITLEEEDDDSGGEKKVIKGGVFAWVGDVGELSDGKFDIDEYIEGQKRRFRVAF